MINKNNMELMLGNEALARGLVENGCRVAASYPGTPASEILSSVAKWKKSENIENMHVQWAVNEKIAFEIAYTGSIAGLRCAVAMKQVGLNVASDPFMSAAYLGVKGGFIVIAADDPGPHSSQTEQDSRLYAMSAKVPVLDPDSPLQARDMMEMGFMLSEKFEIPVMVRPTTRVCHARQDIEKRPIKKSTIQAAFEKNPGRWAATPKFRYVLHNELEKKLRDIAAWDKSAPICVNMASESKKAILVSGVIAAHVKEIAGVLGLEDKATIYQVIQPYPLHTEFTENILENYDDILVLEETTGVIELQLGSRFKVKGKRNGYVPETGELLPEIVEKIIAEFVGVQSKSGFIQPAPGRRPTLCAGCPHRASFFGIKKAAPKGIYPGDIGCYTLGMNLGGVDTVLCMGASISQAAGFAHAYSDEDRPPIVATIGDSTFFHAGVPALIDAVVQEVPILVVILDNRTTAMTGHQPTPASGRDILDREVACVDIEKLVAGCGVKYCKTVDPMDFENFMPLMKEAVKASMEDGPCVVIARSPCVLTMSKDEIKSRYTRLEIGDTCDGCGFCTTHFECPALVMDAEKEKMHIDYSICTGCGVCLHVCPKHSIVKSKA